MRNTEAIHRSDPPLRWIANLSSHLATNHLVKAFDLQERKKLGLRFKYEVFMWEFFNKPYARWGTYYKIDRLDK